MFKKISIKLLLTYFLILIFTFSATTIIYNLLSRRYLLNETQLQLKEEGKAVSELLTNIPLDNKIISANIAEKIRERQLLKTAKMFVDAEILVIGKNGRVLYSDSAEISKRITDIIGTLDNVRSNGYVVTRTPIEAKNGTVKGQVILYTQLKNVYSLNKLMRRTQAISFIIAGMLALLIGYMFEKSITNPIKQLMYKMKSFSEKKTTNLPDIKTGDEIEKLDMSFKEMINKIKQYDEAQTKFLQNTSHELKTPLMSIQGYAEAIKDGIVEGEDANEALDIIIEQSQRLKKTVEEIVYLTKLESIDENFIVEKSDLIQCIHSAIRSIKPLADDNNIQIELLSDNEAAVFIDNEKITRALVNILGNAVRYAENSIKITIQNNDKYVIIIIEDDGPGFDAGEESKVFDRFYKGHGGNTGLGLAITKAIIDNHKGEITAYNANPRGAVFEIKLPQNKNNAQ